MKLIRYKAKPDRAAENEGLVRQVFQELQAKRPDGFRYMTLRLGDGTFMHIFADEDGRGSGGLTGLESFRSFQEGVRERSDEPPQASEATLVGNYRMLGD